MVRKRIEQKNTLCQEDFPHIAFDATGAVMYRGTGIGTYTYQLAKNLQHIVGKSIEFIWPYHEYLGLDFSDSAVLSALSEDKYYYRKEILPGWLEKNYFDIYHVPQNGIGLAVNAQCKKVVTVHDLIPYVCPKTVGKGYLKEFLGQMPDIIKNADGIIAVSEYTKKDILKFFDYPEERIEVIYEAAEPVHAPMQKQFCKEILKTKYGIENDYLLYVGGFGERKNVEALMVAFSLLKKKLSKPLNLVCTGRQGNAKKYLKDLANALRIDKDVIFTGFIPLGLLPYFYGGAEAMVYPSQYEGFGLPVLEAMACGCPVITANNSSLPEVAGDAAVYFNEKDAWDMAEVIAETVNDEEKLKAMSWDGLLQSSHFDWEKNAEKTISFYKKIMDMPFFSNYKT